MTNVPASWNICAAPPNGICYIQSPLRGATGIDYARKTRCSVIGLAITEMFLGICLLGLGISIIPVCQSEDGCADPYRGDWYYYYYGVWSKMGTNIWGGALVILFSSFGLAQGCSPSSCTIGTNLALSVIGIIFSLFLCGLEITAACMSYESESLVILHSIASGFWFILFILFIVSSSYAGIARRCCCRGCCCCDPYDSDQNIAVFPAHLQNNAVTLPNGQTVVFQGQQQMQPNMTQPPQYSQVQLHVPSVAGPSSGSINPTFQADLPPKV